MITRLYVSPHLDDAVFSCVGGILAERHAGDRVVVCTVFDGGDPQRLAEDDAALGALGAEALRLGFPDAPDREGFAPSFRTLILEAPLEPRWVEAVARALQAVVDRLAPASVGFPLAVGGHVDHRTVFEAALRVTVPGERVFYEERPYGFVPSFRALRALELVGGRLLRPPSPSELRRQVLAAGCGAMLGDDADGCLSELAGRLAAPHPGRAFRLCGGHLRLPNGSLAGAMEAVALYRSQADWLFGDGSPESLWSARARSGAAHWLERRQRVLAG